MINVDFFGHKVSKLIVGDNPFNGHSYINQFFPKEEMLDYHTEEKILEAKHRMEELGVNTMLPLADPYIIRILQRYRRNGGKMNFIFQTYSPMVMSKDVAEVSIRLMTSVEPIGMYLSGTYCDMRYDLDTCGDILDMVQLLRSGGVPVGIGTHYPAIIEKSEAEGWDIDFYMACMYNARRGREFQESGFITGNSKSGVLNFQPEDRAVMLDALKNVQKPIIAFKLFAGGQMLVEKEDAERRNLIKDTYRTVFSSLKENDLGVVGVFQKYHDQIKENVDVFNEWESENK